MAAAGSGNRGYYRFPSLAGDDIAFVAEDDLWMVAATGGAARRLTAGVGEAVRPALSPDGQWIAFSGREEGPPDVYLMPTAGGPARRLTFLGQACHVFGWTPDGQSVLFASNDGQPFPQSLWVHEAPLAGGLPIRHDYGPATTVSYGPGGGLVLGRRTLDPARWKRYRGGTAGDLWIRPSADAPFRRLLSVDGNPCRPMWIGDRIYFLADHEGVGNLYSCTPAGDDLRRHTDHEDYYVRNPASDGRRIVYHAGGDLYLFDPERDDVRPIDVTLPSSRVQRSRRFVDADLYLESYMLHPEGHSLALVSRGQAFTLGNWEGAVCQHGPRDGIRHQFTQYLHDGRRLVTVADVDGVLALEVHPVPEADGGRDDAAVGSGAGPVRLAGLDIGRPIELLAHPNADKVALVNHRLEVMLVDLAAATATVVDTAEHPGLGHLAWSPAGDWLAYTKKIGMHVSAIHLCETATGVTQRVTEPVMADFSPTFCPSGDYLYFLSFRDFAAEYDSLHFELGFPRGIRPYALPLRADLRSPFLQRPRPLASKGKGSGEDDDDEDDDRAAEAEAAAGEPAKPADDAPADKPLRIDFAGIAQRALAFPVPVRRYSRLLAVKGKVLYTIEPELSDDPPPSWQGSSGPPARATLHAFDFEENEAEEWANEVTDFDISLDYSTIVYRSERSLRVIKATGKPSRDRESDGQSRKTGWIDLFRIRLSVRPEAEWVQMFREAWRLQKEHFWTPDMSQVDWQAVLDRYLPLVDRLTTRGELSDLIWEMQGELGTSHAYEVGGDYRRGPYFHQGYLGADLAWDEAADGYRITHLVHGDRWSELASSPLLAPGLNIREGDWLVALDNQPLGPTTTPAELLVETAGEEVLVTVVSTPAAAVAEAAAVADNPSPRPRTLTIRPLADESVARYRDWVNGNRAAVHAASGGRVGYIHVPDMGAGGFAEFHRGYLAEIDREGLIVDVRFNRGGHVSQLLLEKLARRRLGYDVPRYGKPMPYPDDSVAGPIVALTNEHAGSDGDIFSHCFKLMGLGPLIGTRTWGGVIGIWVRHRLVDGTATTQPEFAFWFKDVGWAVENYGTDPDLVVEITPDDYRAGRDPQLAKGIAEVLRLLDCGAPLRPAFDPRPARTKPPLPPRR